MSPSPEHFDGLAIVSTNQKYILALIQNLQFRIAEMREFIIIIYVGSN